MKGKFIVFEGIKGSGKKTHIRILADRLQKLGIGVVVISFPNFETDVARLTRRSDFDPYTLSLLYAADRMLYQERIKGLIDRGTIVISDRYCYSNFAYQSARGIELEWLESIEKNVIKPSMVILIDVPIEASMKRVQQANIEDFTKKEMLDRMERDRDVTESIRNVYLQLARKNQESKWLVVDGTQELAKNQQQIWDFVSAELGI
jgi:dTMP kinase